MEKIDIVRKIFEDENDVTFTNEGSSDYIGVKVGDCPIRKSFLCYGIKFEESMNEIVEYIEGCRELMKKDGDEILSYESAIAYVDWKVASSPSMIRVYSYDKEKIVFWKASVNGYIIVDNDNSNSTKKSIDYLFAKMVEAFDNGEYIKNFHSAYMDVSKIPLNDNYLSTEYYCEEEGLSKTIYYYWIDGNNNKRYISKGEWNELGYNSMYRDPLVSLKDGVIEGMEGNFSITLEDDNIRDKFYLNDEVSVYRVTSKLGYGVGGFIAFLSYFRSIFGEIHILHLSNEEVYFYVKN